MNVKHGRQFICVLREEKMKKIEKRSLLSLKSSQTSTHLSENVQAFSFCHAEYSIIIRKY